jgi:hypothetical protein
MLVCPSNGNEDAGCFMHQWVVSTDLGTLTWFKEIRVTTVVDFGESLLAIHIKTGNESQFPTDKWHVPQCLVGDVVRCFEEL